MGRNYIKHNEIQVNPPIHELEDRYYTTREVAIAINRHYITVHGYIQKGLIKAEKGINGFYRIPKSELVRLLGGEPEEKQYLAYDSVKVPHLAYLMHALIETGNNSQEINKRLAEYRLPRIPEGAMRDLWEALVKTASWNISSAMRKRKSVIRTKGFRDWIESLGIAPLFDHPVFPCRGLLLDHSTARFTIEALIGGRVALQEISDFVYQRWGKLYTIEQLQWFQYYFFNVLEFTAHDYLCYLKLVKDPEEQRLKRCAWDDPATAKTLVGAPTRVNFEEGLYKFAEVAAMALREYISNPHKDPAELKRLSDVYYKAHERILRQNKAVQEDMEIATERAAAQAESIEIEVVREEPVRFEDLEQPPKLPEKTGEESQRVG